MSNSRVDFFSCVATVSASSVEMHNAGSWVALCGGACAGGGIGIGSRRAVDCVCGCGGNFAVEERTSLLFALVLFVADFLLLLSARLEEEDATGGGCEGLVFVLLFFNTAGSCCLLRRIGFQRKRLCLLRLVAFTLGMTTSIFGSCLFFLDASNKGVVSCCSFSTTLIPSTITTKLLL